MPRYVIVSILLACGLVACSGGNSTAPDASIAIVAADAGATGGAGATDGAGATGGNDAPASPGAFYIVPAGPDTPELSYPLDMVRTEVNAGTFRIDYNMPQLLVGNDQQISLRGTLDAAGRTATVSGEAGTAICDLMPGGGATLRCDEALPGIVVDLAGVQRIAQAMAPSTASVYVAVASRFSGEPIGIVELR